jgi:hypothetical protein
MQQLATTFESLQDGQMAAVLDRGGLRNLLKTKTHRYWELAGCTTAGASRSQFEKGTGWWRYFDQHINCTDPAERARRQKYSWDSGVGIKYWRDQYGGSIVDIPIGLVKEGHCSEIGAKNYVSGANHLTPKRNLSAELDSNYSIDEVAARLGIAALLEPAPVR